MTRRLGFASLLISFSLGFAAPASAQSSVISLTDVSPTSSDLDPITPAGASGGRVNGLAVDPTNKLVLYAASEWGGLYKSIDGGVHWNRLNGHRPTATWDVEVDPANPNRVYATSLYDGRVPSLSGINVSTDGGATWTHPASSVPPAGFCANPADQTELAAFGITIDPTNAARVYIGTSCGLAFSNNSGSTWTYTSPVAGAMRLWDAQVTSDGNYVDTCGDSGHRYYNRINFTWVAGVGLPSGTCSLAANPYNALDLLAVVGTTIYETTDATNWTPTRTNPWPQGRIPFVATNRRSLAPAGQVFDLWFGDTDLHRVPCDTGTAGSKCGTGNTPAWVGGYTWTAGGHADMGAILFDPTVANDACPILMSSDGGVYYNTLTTSPACHAPVWEQPMVTPRALWPWTLTGADRSGAGDETLFFGNQDNGMFGTTNAGAPVPAWVNDAGDSFDAVATGSAAGSLVYSLCCFSGRATHFVRKNADFSGGYEINYPTGGLPLGFQFPDVLARWSELFSYAMLTNNCTSGSGGCVDSDGGLYVTPNISATPIVWTELGNASEPQHQAVCANYPPRTCNPGLCDPGESCVPVTPCAVYTAADDATFYVQTSSFLETGCNGDSLSDQMWKFTGTNPSGSWTKLTLPGGEGFGIFAVDPANPNRLMASGVSPTGAVMYRSNNGGASWSSMPPLDALMNGGGDFPMKNARGVTGSANIKGYHQPSFAAFDPFSPHSNLIAGGRDSGIFYSTDDGATWSLVTDPRNSNVSGTPHVPRPKHAYFSQADHNKSVYVTSQGRGVWRLGICGADTYEPDDSSATAKTIVPGVPQARTLCAIPDGDFAKFTLTAPSSVRIETSGIAGDTTLTLRNSALAQISFDNDGGADAFSLIERTCASPATVLAPGTYYIEVRENGQNDTIAEYTLSLIATPCCGNGVLDSGNGETCDDGNVSDGDCCSSACASTPAGTACASDGDTCTVDACNGLGACVSARPSAPGAVAGATMSASNLTWPAVSGATAYDVVFGNLGQLRSNGGNYSNAVGSCLAEDLPGTTYSHAANLTAPGSGLYFLVRSTNCGGPGTYDTASPRQVASRDPGINAAPSTCGFLCKPGRCAPGPVFTGACAADPCVSAICAADPTCCSASWTAQCVQEMRTVCGSLTCIESAPACAHTLCVQGVKLVSGCDSPPLAPSCVGTICSADPFCCNTQWDVTCVGEVSSLCGRNCN